MAATVFQELLGMAERSIAELGSAHHARHFFGPLRLLEQPHRGFGVALFLLFLDQEVRIGEGGDLGQMRHAQYLLGL